MVFRPWQKYRIRKVQEEAVVKIKFILDQLLEIFYGWTAHAFVGLGILASYNS